MHPAREQLWQAGRASSRGTRRNRPRGALAWLAAAMTAIGCGGAGVGRGADSEAARGAPPAKQDTVASDPTSHPSPAGGSASPQPRVLVHPVNTGPHGMAARVRWLLSPGRDAIVVVEDAVGVEAEPVPDGFVFASERTGAVVQVDGVWDVAPSPDWTRLAVARAFVFRSGESDTIPTGEWERLFAWLPEDVAAPSTAAMRRIAERYTFPASGMSYARALGLTQVVDVGGRPPGRAAFVAGPAVRLEGWRVRWTPSGDTLAVGAASAMVQDDAPPSRWTLVRPRDVRSWRDSLGVAPHGLALHEVRWTEGPTLDVSLRIDTTAERRIAIGAGEVVSRNGSIERRANGVRQGVGRGVALAATTSGRFIAALAPVQGAGEFDLTHRVVVYEVVP